MILQEPFGWVWEVRFNEIQRHKASNTGNTKYYTAANTQDNQPNDPITLKDALEHLQEEHLLVNKIGDAILNNELGSESKAAYSTYQLAQIIQQKYFPPASDHQIISLLSSLVGRSDKVATITNHLSPDHQVTMWQSRNRYNDLNAIDNKHFLYPSRL
jgi:hypothetical protein